MQVYEYENDTKSSRLQQALKAALPYSINLVYRTQHPNRSRHAHILATIPKSCTSAALPKCWSAAYFDRSMRPETELWIFSAGEQPGHSPSGTFCTVCRTTILALFDYMSTVATPPMHPESLPALELAKRHEIEFPSPGPTGVYALSPGTYARHLLSPQVITIGACHRDVLQICQEAQLVRSEFPGPTSELNKFIFGISDLPKTENIPTGLRWGVIRSEDIPLVKARTSIPRSTRTLLSLQSVGVFEEATNSAIGWAFLGLDGSLTTLHTEENYRGKGIAKAVASKIMSQRAPGLAVSPDGNAWSHADVYLGNVQSESVCRSLGGKAMWKCFWVRIDLEKAGDLVRNIT